MCLIKVTKRYEKPTKAAGFGYKVFDAYGSALSFEYRLLAGDHIVQTGEWLTAESRLIGGSEEYRSGFHIFKTESDARAWGVNHDGQKIVRVRWRGKLAEGLQVEGSHVIVAAQMYVPKPRKTKKRRKA